MTEEDLLLLQNTFTFWPHLTKPEQDKLIHSVYTTTFHLGEVVHHSEHNCLGILIVKKGVLRSYMLSEKGRDITLYRLYPGDVCMLSATCVLSHITFDIHVEATSTQTEVLVINSATFSQLIQSNIYAENFSYKAIVDKFSNVMWTMEQILFMSFDARLALFLLEESKKTQSSTLFLTHEQIAKYMGSAREVVSRMIKYFVAEGLITSYRGKITLINIPSLKTLSLGK